MVPPRAARFTASDAAKRRDMSNASALGLGPTSRECACRRSAGGARLCRRETGHDPIGVTTGILPARRVHASCPTDSRHLARTLLDKLEFAPSDRRLASARDVATRTPSRDSCGFSPRRCVRSCSSPMTRRCPTVQRRSARPRREASRRHAIRPLARGRRCRFEIGGGEALCV
jgi:hypothetical protein